MGSTKEGVDVSLIALLTKFYHECNSFLKLWIIFLFVFRKGNGTLFASYCPSKPFSSMILEKMIILLSTNTVNIYEHEEPHYVWQILKYSLFKPDDFHTEWWKRLLILMNCLIRSRTFMFSEMDKSTVQLYFNVETFVISGVTFVRLAKHDILFYYI